MAGIMNEIRLRVKRLLFDISIKHIIIFILLIQLIFCNSIFTMGCSGIYSGPSMGTNYPYCTNDVRSSQGTWEALNLWNDNEELNAVAVGDVDKSHNGDEIVVAGESNTVTVIYGFGSSWVAETIFKDSWYVTAIAIGDVYPLHPGNEIVVVGWSTYVTMLYKSTETNKWVSKRLFQDYDWLYDVAIGDIYPEHTGNEIVFVGDPRHVIMLNYSRETDTWGNKILWDNTPDINVVVIGDFNSSHQGSEVAVTGVNVKEIKLREIVYNHSTGKWNTNIMGDVEKDPLDMVAGDFYSGHPGDELALVSIQRSVLMIHQSETFTGWKMEKLWQDIESIRDLEISDIVPEHPGNELVLVGYSNSATILMEGAKSTSGWESTMIYTSDSNLNGVAAGEFDAFHSGGELALLQSVGKLVKLLPEINGFNLFTPQSQYIVPPGNSISVPIIINEEGDFSDQIELSIINNSELSSLGIAPDFNWTRATPPAAIELKLTISKTTVSERYEISIMGTAQSLVEEKYLNFTLFVLPSNSPAFNLTVFPSISSVVADFSKEFQLFSNSLNAWDQAISLNIRYLPPGVSYLFNSPTALPPDKTQLTITTTSGTPEMRYFIIITGTSHSNSTFQHSCVLILDIRPPQPDFMVEVKPKEVHLPINGSASSVIFGFSYSGFNEQITFAFSGLPAGVATRLVPDSIIPTANTTVIFTSKHETELKRYNVTVIGTSAKSKIEHLTFLHIILEPEVPGFNISLHPKKSLIVLEGQTAVLELTITPIAGFSDEINIRVLGLEKAMNWNDELSPISLNRQQNISIMISGLNDPGVFDLTLEVSDGNQSKKQVIQLEVLPEIKSDDGIGKNEQLIQIIILVIILLIIIIISIKLSSRTRTPEPEKKDKVKHKGTIKKKDIDKRKVD